MVAQGHERVHINVSCVYRFQVDEAAKAIEQSRRAILPPYHAGAATAEGVYVLQEIIGHEVSIICTLTNSPAAEGDECCINL